MPQTAATHKAALAAIVWLEVTQSVAIAAGAIFAPSKGAQNGGASAAALVATPLVMLLIYLGICGIGDLIAGPRMNPSNKENGRIGAGRATD